MVLCSQVFSIAAPGPNSTSPHTAAALPSLSLYSPIVHAPTPSLIHRPHRESPFRLEERSVCVLVHVEYACLGETGCFRHLPTATPPPPHPPPGASLQGLCAPIGGGAATLNEGMADIVGPSVLPLIV